LSNLDLRQGVDETAQTVGSRNKINPMKISGPKFPNQQPIMASPDRLAGQVVKLSRLRSATAPELDALLPSVLYKPSKGEL
jgi:hypothetical protein